MFRGHTRPPVLTGHPLLHLPPGLLQMRLCSGGCCLRVQFNLPAPSLPSGSPSPPPRCCLPCPLPSLSPLLPLEPAPLSVSRHCPSLNWGFCLLQGIFPTQEWNWGLLHCRQILYSLSHHGSPRILEWVAYPLSRSSSQPRNQIRVSCIAG